MLNVAKKELEKKNYLIINDIKIIPYFLNLNNLQQINKLISELKKTIIINIFKYKEKNTIKIILTNDIQNVDASTILNNLKEKNALRWSWK
jgi:hypothetical protein